jgi:hypothetical protein
MAIADDIHDSAQKRRTIAMRAIGRELDGRDAASSASRLRALAVAANPRPMLIGGDIDGIVSAAMLGSVMPHFKVAAALIKSDHVLVHPDYVHTPLAHFFGVDVFSLQFDNISNHVEYFGGTQLQNIALREAYQRWDRAIDDAIAGGRFFAAPNVWARIQGGREGAKQPDSSKFKYPFGTAQITLALLEAAGLPPRFYDQTYLPWLVANADGGIATFSEHGYNARVWWPVMAGAIGPGSLTASIYDLLRTMRPHDFQNAVHQLERERGSRLPFLNDKWKLADDTPSTLERTFEWLAELTGWRDPVVGGIGQMHKWHLLPLLAGGQVPLSAPKTGMRADAPATIDGARLAINANFRQGGHGGSRFNWVGDWRSL